MLPPRSPATETRRRATGRPGVAALWTTLIALVTWGMVWLPGCGGADDGGGATTAGAGGDLAGLSADQVLERARGAARSAGTVHVTGEQGGGDQRISLDLTLERDTGGAGLVVVQGGRVEVVRTGKDVFLRADESILASSIGDGGEAAARLVGGRFVKIPADDRRFSGFASLLDLGEFVNSVLTPAGETSREPGKVVDGVPTVAIRAEDGGGTLYVADRGEPYPLLIEPGNGPGGGSLSMSGWGEEVTITPPPADQVVDLADLPG